MTQIECYNRDGLDWGTGQVTDHRVTPKNETLTISDYEVCQCQCQCQLRHRDLTSDKPAIGFDAVPHNMSVSWVGSLVGTYLEVSRSPCTSAAGRKSLVVMWPPGQPGSRIPGAVDSEIRGSARELWNSLHICKTRVASFDRGTCPAPMRATATHGRILHLYQNPQSLRTRRRSLCRSSEQHRKVTNGGEEHQQ